MVLASLTVKPEASVRTTSHSSPVVPGVQERSAEFSVTLEAARSETGSQSCEPSGSVVKLTTVLQAL